MGKGKFSRNTKYYDGVVYEFNLPAGWSCPYAKECVVKVDRETGKFDNQSHAFRCYAASAERFPSCRKSRWSNFDFVSNGGVVEVPTKAKAVRIHSSGDFFSQKYFDMWLDVCASNPDVEFWAFTKSVRYWVNRINEIPPNLVLTASRGGKDDYLIDKYDLKNAEVIKDMKDANGRPLDTTDDQARIPNVNFVLMDNFVKK